MTFRPLPIFLSLLLFAASIFLGVAGCSITSSSESTFEPTTEQLRRVTHQVPTFGGVLFEQDQLVVFVLGSTQTGAAQDSLREIFGTEAAEIDLKVRSPEGNASEELKRSASNILTIEEASSLDFDEKTGYLRVGVTEVKGIRKAMDKLKEIDIPLGEVILQVESPVVAL